MGSTTVASRDKGSPRKASVQPTVPWQGAVLVGSLVVVAYLLLHTSHLLAVGAFGDDGVYVALGRALASGQGYRSIYAVGEPIHAKYPPGLPLMFALAWWVGGNLATTAGILRILSIIVSGISAGLIWWLGKSELRLSTPAVLLFGVGFLLLENTIQYFTLPISEPHFLLAWVAAVVLYYRIKRGARGTGLPWGALALGLVVGWTCLIRTQGIILIPALAVAMVVDRFRWRSRAAFIMASLAPVFLWRWRLTGMLRGSEMTSQLDEAPYLDWIPVHDPGALLDFLTSSFASNWSGYWDGIPSNFSIFQSLGVGLTVFLLLLTLGGGLRLLRKHSALVLTVTANAAVIAVWPYAQDRFVLAMLPMAGLLMADAVDWSSVGRSRWVQVLVATLILISATSVATRQIHLRWEAYQEEEPKGWLSTAQPTRLLLKNARFLASVADWVLQNTSPEDHLITPYNAGVYLYTGRRTVNGQPAERDIGGSVFDRPGEYLVSRIWKDAVNVVIMPGPDWPISRDISAVQERCPELLVWLGLGQRYSLTGYYRVRPDPACMRREFSEVFQSGS